MKFLLLLLVVSAWVQAKSYTSEIIQTGSKKLQLLREGKLDELKSWKLTRGSRLTSGQQPLKDMYDFYYLVNVSIGTPSQVIPVEFDTLTSDIWVIDSAHNVTMNQIGFNANQSSTFTVKDSTNRYMDDPFVGYFSYYIGNDKMRLGDLQVSKQDLLLATKLAPVFYVIPEPENGVLGMGINMDPKTLTQGPVSNLLRQLDQELFTVWFDKKVTINTTGNGGLVTYGAVDTTNCDSHWSYAPLVNPDVYSWRWTINGYTIGLTKDMTKSQVIVATSSPWIEVPDATLRKILFATGAKYNTFFEIFTIDCSAKHLPDFVIHAYGGPSQPSQSFNLNIPASTYVMDVGLNDGSCALAFQTSQGYESDTNVWILGDTFLRNYCSIFDYGNRRMGFAKPKQSL